MKTTIWRPAPTRKRTLRGIVTAGAVAATLLLGTVAAAATTPTGTQDQTAQATAPSQSEQERTQARHRALGALAAQPAASQPERTLARHRALGTLDTLAAPAAIAAQPAAKTDPAAPSPGVNILATLLVGLVGGLIGGAAAMVGWTAMTRRRRAPAAASP